MRVQSAHTTAPPAGFLCLVPGHSGSLPQACWSWGYDGQTMSLGLGCHDSRGQGSVDAAQDITNPMTGLLNKLAEPSAD